MEDETRLPHTQQAFNSFGISDDEFSLFQELIYKMVGIYLNQGKKMLLISRLSKRLRMLGMTTFRQYYDHLLSSSTDQDELVRFINQVTTNKTDFFREIHHFDQMKSRLLPMYVANSKKNGTKDIKIWSAGCSTGEEPYTIAITVAEYMKTLQAGIPVKILATDIDTGVLKHAQEGVYRTDRLSGVPEELRASYFRHLPDGNWKVEPQVREMVKFGRFNLMHQFPFKFGFDLIFCRNVLIYFTPQDRRDLILKFRSMLRPSGCLILGHSESLIADGLGFKSLGMTIYQLPDQK